jgi:hypothetical protein
VLEAKSLDVGAPGPIDARAVDCRDRGLLISEEVLRRIMDCRGGDFLFGLLGEGDRVVLVRRREPES